MMLGFVVKDLFVSPIARSNIFKNISMRICICINLITVRLQCSDCDLLSYCNVPFTVIHACIYIVKKNNYVSNQY